MAVEADDLEPRERLDERIGGPSRPKQDDRAVPVDLAHPGQPVEGAGGRRRGECHLDAA